MVKVTNYDLNRGMVMQSNDIFNTGPELNFNELKALGLSCGFFHVAKLNPNTIKVHEEVREACADNKCGAYGSNWSCPPACGGLKEIETLIRKYHHGLILQTKGELEDSFDYETMVNIEKEHSKALKTFSAKMEKIHPSAMVLGAGACTICKKCTYPKNPCRFPDKMINSMEAFGMVVSDVCKANGIQYYYGERTLTYVGCVLID